MTIQLIPSNVTNAVGGGVMYASIEAGLLHKTIQTGGGAVKRIATTQSPRRRSQCIAQTSAHLTMWTSTTYPKEPPRQRGGFSFYTTQTPLFHFVLL